MPRTRRARPAGRLLSSTDMAASSVAGGMQQAWGQPLLFRVTGSGGSAETADQDPPPLILADGTRISFVERQ